MERRAIVGHWRGCTEVWFWSAAWLCALRCGQETDQITASTSIWPPRPRCAASTAAEFATDGVGLGVAAEIGHGLPARPHYAVPARWDLARIGRKSFPMGGEIENGDRHRFYKVNRGRARSVPPRALAGAAFARGSYGRAPAGRLWPAAGGSAPLPDTRFARSPCSLHRHGRALSRARGCCAEAVRPFLTQGVVTFATGARLMDMKGVAPCEDRYDA